MILPTPIGIYVHVGQSSPRSCICCSAYGCKFSFDCSLQLIVLT